MLSFSIICLSYSELADAQIDITLSPKKSATEMYRSAVANVRKSAKRIAPQLSSDPVKKANIPALLPAECEDNLLATGDWLIDDYNNAPAKKKQKVAEALKPSQR